ncbi:MAG: bifunctional 5,10-methylenetetrahydrofolate dehydrogenase/5,10-methenyltetrahydrofolate cyclohydrolase [bacterium]|nr:bifunctional 5,10-methylenetetrahydrofolate dehydrogenase/5,10-methenyltetrahydrofolate cyclohydrolase [bacterium]
MRLLDGKKVSQDILDEITAAVALLPRAPRMAVVQVGDDPGSAAYIRNKIRAAGKTGIESEHVHLDGKISQSDLNTRMAELSASNLDGLMLQLPLPAHLNEGEALEYLDPDKDIDGFHPVNLGRLISGLDCYVPCTPAGIRELLKREEIPTSGRHVVIVGRSLIVGKTAALLLLEKSDLGNATVTVCHSASDDLAVHCRQADILIAAVGRAFLIKADMVKEGAIIIDVGMNSIEAPERRSGYRLVGDCDFDGIGDRAAAMTPVPGGVGPLTVAMLMSNALQAAKRYIGQEN